MLEFIKRHKKGIVGTIIFHGILGLLFIFFGFSTPLPLPAEKGIMINFGNMPDAAGSTELRQSASREESEPSESQVTQQEQTQTRTRESQPQEQQESVQEDQDVTTQNFEEAPAVDTKKEEQTSEPQEDQQTGETEEVTEEQQQDTRQEEEQTEPEREVNENALYSGESTSESGETEGETEGSGNQGRQSGSPFSDNHANVDSKGMGGVDFSLDGRNPESLPKPEYNYQVEGKVVVEITVDKYGKVTNVIAGVKGSTTLNDKLLESAKKAAQNARFDRKPDAPAYQKGTITYYFRLQ